MYLLAFFISWTVIRSSNVQKERPSWFRLLQNKVGEVGNERKSEVLQSKEVVPAGDELTTVDWQYKYHTQTLLSAYFCSVFAKKGKWLSLRLVQQLRLSGLDLRNLHSNLAGMLTEWSPLSVNCFCGADYITLSSIGGRAGDECKHNDKQNMWRVMHHKKYDLDERN